MGRNNGACRVLLVVGGVAWGQMQLARLCSCDRQGLSGACWAWWCAGAGVFVPAGVGSCSWCHLLRSGRKDQAWWPCCSVICSQRSLCSGTGSVVSESWEAWLCCLWVWEGREGRREDSETWGRLTRFSGCNLKRPGRKTQLPLFLCGSAGRGCRAWHVWSHFRWAFPRWGCRCGSQGLSSTYLQGGRG